MPELKILLSDRMNSLLQELSKRTGRKKSELVRDAIQEYILQRFPALLEVEK